MELVGGMHDLDVMHQMLLACELFAALWAEKLAAGTRVLGFHDAEFLSLTIRKKNMLLNRVSF